MEVVTSFSLDRESYGFRSGLCSICLCAESVYMYNLCPVLSCQLFGVSNSHFKFSKTRQSFLCRSLVFNLFMYPILVFTGLYGMMPVPNADARCGSRRGGKQARAHIEVLMDFHGLRLCRVGMGMPGRWEVSLSASGGSGGAAL